MPNEKEEEEDKDKDEVKQNMFAPCVSADKICARQSTHPSMAACMPRDFTTKSNT